MPTSSALNAARDVLLANLNAINQTNPLSPATAQLALLSLIADNAGGGGSVSEVTVSNFPITQIVNQSSNTATTATTFSSGTISSTFAIANRLALIVCPTITGAPTLTLQVTLNGGTTWANTGITLATSATESKVIGADLLAKVSGAFGLDNAFRFSSTASISATLNIRSIAQ